MASTVLCYLVLKLAVSEGGEAAQRLRILAPFVEDLGSVLSSKSSCLSIVWKVVKHRSSVSTPDLLILNLFKDLR